MAVASVGAGGSGSGAASAGPSSTMTSTESGSDAVVGGCVGRMISKDKSNVTCSPSESKTNQPSVSFRRTRTSNRWLLFSIDQIGLSDVSPDFAPLFEIDDLRGGRSQ